VKQEMMGWQRHQLDHMQIICTFLQTDKSRQHLITQLFTGWMLFLVLSNSVKAPNATLQYHIIGTKDQTSLSNSRDMLHHSERAANK